VAKSTRNPNTASRPRFPAGAFYAGRAVQAGRGPFNEVACWVVPGAVIMMTAARHFAEGLAGGEYSRRGGPAGTDGLPE
jgi:hypothetical protein